VVLLVIIGIGALPVWICSLTYGIIGIEVGRTWPNPSCCCYKTPYSGGDPGAGCLGCLPIFNTCVVLLVLQSIYLLIDVACVALFRFWMNIIGMVFDLAGVGILIAAVVLLRLGYSRDGKPKPVARHGPVALVQDATPVTGVRTIVVGAPKPGFQDQQVPLGTSLPY
jgi:hypothetical protein